MNTTTFRNVLVGIATGAVVVAAGFVARGAYIDAEPAPRPSGAAVAAPAGCYAEPSAVAGGVEIIFYPRMTIHAVPGFPVPCPTTTVGGGR